MYAPRLYAPLSSFLYGLVTFASHNYCILTREEQAVSAYKAFDSIFQYLRCSSCWRPHFIVLKFLHAPILEGREGGLISKMSGATFLIVELPGQSPASPRINCVASYFQRISCSADTNDFITTKTILLTFLVDLKLFLQLMLTVSVSGLGSISYLRQDGSVKTLAVTEFLRITNSGCCLNICFILTLSSLFNLNCFYFYLLAAL